MKCLVLVFVASLLACTRCAGAEVPTPSTDESFSQGQKAVFDSQAQLDAAERERIGAPKPMVMDSPVALGTKQTAAPSKPQLKPEEAQEVKTPGPNLRDINRALDQR